MLIDWFTVAAQGLNFIVLVGLLKRFLYRPVLAAIDAREKHIALAIADADSQKQAVQRERTAFETEKAALDAEGAALLKQAVSAAGAKNARFLADARTEAGVLREKQMAALREEMTRLRENIAQLAQQEVLAIARKVLVDLTGASLEERMMALFLQRLHGLSGPAKLTLLTAFSGASEAVIHTAFVLAETQRSLIQIAVTQEFSTPISLRFDVAPEMLCGVDLLVSGQRLSWNIADYLDGLEQRIVPMSEAAATPGGASISASARAVPAS